MVLSPIVPGTPNGLVSVHPWDRYSPRATTSVWHKSPQGIRTWSDTGPLPYPHEIHEVSFFFDPRRQRVLYYGGENAELFALDMAQASPKWARLKVRAADGGQLPTPNREVVYVPKHDVFLLLEGARKTERTQAEPAIWSLDTELGLFRRVKMSFAEGVDVGEGPGDVKPASVSTGLAYDPVSDVCFYIGAGGSSPSVFAFRYLPEHCPEGE